MMRGRGTAGNPRNRFESSWYEFDEEPGAAGAPRTRFLDDASRSVLSHNESPDVPFEVSLNPYRGCEHGCVYCYARPTHEYLGLSAGLDFETRIVVKRRAPEILESQITARRWRPRTLALSGVTDPYQPVERRLGLTRRCLEVLARLRHPVLVITKNHLVTRDTDLLASLCRARAAAVCISVTTLDVDLARVLEPRTSAPRRRLHAIEELSRAGIVVGVLVAPVIPGLTDHELPSIVDAAAQAGAVFAGYTLLRLPHGVRDLFSGWLDEHRPERKKKILGRVRSTRGGRLNDPGFGSRMQGKGIFAAQVRSLFRVSCAGSGLREGCPELSSDAFSPSPFRQLTLFDDA